MNRRHTYLYVSGTDEEKFRIAMDSSVDCIIIELEDMVTLDRKAEARETAVRFLNGDRKGKEIGIRINKVLPDNLWRDDLNICLPAHPDFVAIPKSETKEQMLAVDAIIAQYEYLNRIPVNSIYLIPMFETPLGIENSKEIAKLERVYALTLGEEDLCTSLGISRRRVLDNPDFFYIRQKVLFNAKLANKKALESCVVVKGMPDYALQDTINAKNAGYAGRVLMLPEYIDIVNKVFTPGEDEVKYAKKIISAIDEVRKTGVSFTFVDGNYVDSPHYIWAQRILSEA